MKSNFTKHTWTLLFQQLFTHVYKAKYCTLAGGLQKIVLRAMSSICILFSNLYKWIRLKSLNSIGITGIHECGSCIDQTSYHTLRSTSGLYNESKLYFIRNYLLQQSAEWIIEQCLPFFGKLHRGMICG